MDRITKHDLERRLDLLNRYVGAGTYKLSWKRYAIATGQWRSK